MLNEIWLNLTHNLFKPLLLFFYLGFLIAILKVRFELPYVIYQGLTMYLLLAIGWQGGEQLAKVEPDDIDNIAEFIALGCVLSIVIGGFTYVALRYLTPLRQVDRAAIAGYYGSNSAGAYATCVAVLVGLGITFDAYMSFTLVLMDICGCLLALYIVARLRHRGLDSAGFMPGERGDHRAGAPGPAERARGRQDELEFALQRPVHPDAEARTPERTKAPVVSRAIVQEMLRNPGFVLLVGGIVIGFVASIQGQKVVHDQNELFVSAFHGVLCIFLLEMGMTAARRLPDVKSAGAGFVAFGLLAPIVFGTLGMLAAYPFARLTDTHLQPGTYVLFAVLCASASFITLPAVQSLGFPEASPTLPLAASLGLTFTVTVTVGILLFIGINRALAHLFPANWALSQ